MRPTRVAVHGVRTGVIVFAPTASDPISQVSAAGGVPVAVTKLDSSRHERSHRWPHFLPDGKHILFFARASFGGVEREEDALAVASLDGTTEKTVDTGEIECRVRVRILSLSAREDAHGAGV